MPLKNSQTHYGAVTRLLHWITAVLVIGLLAAGLYMTDMPASPDKFKVYGLHKSFGMTVLFLTLCRCLWHRVSKKPDAVATLKRWEKHFSKALHLFLYVLLAAMPLTGWIFSSAANHPVSFFGFFTLPDLVTPDKDLAAAFKELHEIAGTILMIVAGLHALAAFKHHFIDKDSVLRRMLPCLAILLMTTSPAFAAKTWNVLNAKSSINFRAKQMGAEFKGSFERFESTIIFDPANLVASKAVIVIDTASVNTQNAERDENIRGKDWFDVVQFPTARFATSSFRKTGENAYEASAELTIRDRTVPVLLIFKLNIVDGSSDKNPMAIMDGSLVLDRSLFKLGGKNWADTSIIANEVPVDVHVVALLSR